jgi:hypothetical protein
VEADIVLTADAVPIVFHDRTLDRTTDGHGFAADLSLEQMGRLDAGGTFNPQFAGTPVPTLAGSSIGSAKGAFYSHARAKKLPRAAEFLVYSLTPSGVLAENHPKNRGFVGILRGQKCLRRRF